MIVSHVDMPSAPSSSNYAGVSARRLGVTDACTYIKMIWFDFTHHDGSSVPRLTGCSVREFPIRAKMFACLYNLKPVEVDGGTKYEQTPLSVA